MTVYHTTLDRRLPGTTLATRLSKAGDERPKVNDRRAGCEDRVDGSTLAGPPDGCSTGVHHPALRIRRQPLKSINARERPRSGETTPSGSDETGFMGAVRTRGDGRGHGEGSMARGRDGAVALGRWCAVLLLGGVPVAPTRVGGW